MFPNSTATFGYDCDTMIAEFRSFLTKSNALALAVGVIIGVAVGNIVSALAADVLMPIISLALPGGSWREAKIVLTPADAARKVAENAIQYGHFIGTVLDFLIISLVLFLILRMLVKPPKVEAPEPMRQCPQCLEMIPSAAKKCRACTSAV